uniref:Nuclear RNA export factor Tap RNA-binding domain-containing protein n=1 Tax=Otolemur garnettii TaxID=30611 RepID=H0WGH6_OTOGA
ILEYRNGGSTPQGKKANGDSFQRNFGNGRLHKHGGCELLPSHLQEDDENIEMRNVYEGPQVRQQFSTLQPPNRSIELYNECQDRIRCKREMEKKMQEQDLGCWFKITIPHGVKYDRTWLINSIRSHCRVPFTPVDFHYAKYRAQFFVQDAATASALKDVSYKVCSEENRKISIFVSPSEVPYSVKNKLKPEHMEQLKLTMKKRYNISKQALNLQKLRFDSDLMDCKVDIILNQRSCMAATLQIIEKNFPEPKLLSLNLRNNKLYRLDGLSDITEKAPNVKILNLSKNELKSTWELGKVRGLKLEELWLKGNPLCSTFPDKSSYISAILDCFPKLLRLDGQRLTTPFLIEVEALGIIKPCKESYRGSESLKSLVLQFLLQYYLIYDYGDRQGLLNAYHDEACFSLTIPFYSKDPDVISFWKYFKEIRNIKKLKDPDLRAQLLKYTKYEIVNSLSVLPKTQHDLNSCVVDLCIQTERMLCFSVNGVFKELEARSQGCVRAFTRTFILTSGNNCSLRIVNDELIVRNASPREIQSAFYISMPIPFSSSLPTISQRQQEMVQTFPSQFGMDLKWSQNYLQDNEWNSIMADQVFAELQTGGKFPKKGYKQI